MSLTYPCDLAEKDQADLDAGMSPGGMDWFLSCKATADLVVALFLMIATAPLVLALIGLVKATSRGPAIFKQVRLGRDGRPYHLYKIRSMSHDCERLTGPTWATAGDPRVTRLGRFLRRSHLDELPQLWNVVRGDMSLVGPRPERPEFVAKLEREIPDYRERLGINPGITGLAQVQLPPDESVDDVRRKVACDLCYIRQMGPGLDLKILIGTALKVMGLPLDVTRRVLDLPGVFGPAPAGDAATVAEPGSISHLQSA